MRRRAGGRKKQEHTRSDRIVASCYPEDLRDLQALCEAWSVPMSALVWAVLHEWLQRGRRVKLELGDARGALRMALELGLRDRELGAWLRSEANAALRG